MQRTALAGGGPLTATTVVERAPLAQVPEFQLRGLYRQNGEVLKVNGRNAGVILQMPEPDSRIYFLTQRKHDHILRFPRPSWAFACSLIERLDTEGVSWVRVEMRERGERKSWEAPLADLLEQPPSFLLQRGGFEEQVALPLRSWIFIDNDRLLFEKYGWDRLGPEKNAPRSRR